jgi:hypothetical protein
VVSGERYSQAVTGLSRLGCGRERQYHGRGGARRDRVPLSRLGLCAERLAGVTTHPQAYASNG